MATRKTAFQAGWSDELEELHEESSKTHAADVWTREAMVARLSDLAPNSTVIDVGCSTGYLLEDLTVRFPTGRLFGVDALISGLRKAKLAVPAAAIVQADACSLPFPAASFDAVVSANLLEHIADDSAALSEICRVLKPGAIAIVVVPAAPATYDYFDRYLHHERRYGRGELATRAMAQGLVVLEDVHLCSIIFPAFWIVKKRNRLLYDHLRDEELAKRVSRNIATTQGSAVFSWSCRVERWMARHGVHFPFGIRQLTVLQRPFETSR